MNHRPPTRRTTCRRYSRLLDGTGDPVTMLRFLGLEVIPHLEPSGFGPVDVGRFEILPLRVRRAGRKLTPGMDGFGLPWGAGLVEELHGSRRGVAGPFEDRRPFSGGGGGAAGIVLFRTAFRVRRIRWISPVRQEHGSLFVPACAILFRAPY